MRQVISIAALLLMANVLLAQSQIELKWNYYKIDDDNQTYETGHNNKDLRAILSQHPQATSFAKQSAQWGTVKFIGYGITGLGILSSVWNTEFSILGTGAGVIAMITGAALQRKHLHHAVDIFNQSSLQGESYQPFLEFDAASDKQGFKLVYNF